MQLRLSWDRRCVTGDESRGVFGGQQKRAVSIGKTSDGAEDGQRRNGGSQKCGGGSGEFADHGDLL